MPTNPAVEQLVRDCKICPVRKEKVYGGNDLPKSQDLSSEWKPERVREDISGYSEDGEDDELSYVW